MGLAGGAVITQPDSPEGHQGAENGRLEGMPAAKGTTLSPTTSTMSEYSYLAEQLALCTRAVWSHHPGF